MAELTDAEKDAISHRAGAVAELLAWLAGASAVLSRLMPAEMATASVDAGVAVIAVEDEDAGRP